MQKSFKRKEVYTGVRLFFCWFKSLLFNYLCLFNWCVWSVVEGVRFSPPLRQCKRCARFRSSTSHSDALAQWLRSPHTLYHLGHQLRLHSHRNHSGITAESQRNHSGITAESQRNHSGITAE